MLWGHADQISQYYVESSEDEWKARDAMKDKSEEHVDLPMSYWDIMNSDNEDGEEDWLFCEFPTVEGVHEMYLKDSRWPFEMFPWVEPCPPNWNEIFPNPEPEWQVPEPDWQL